MDEKKGILKRQFSFFFMLFSAKTRFLIINKFSLIIIFLFSFINYIFVWNVYGISKKCCKMDLRLNEVEEEEVREPMGKFYN